MRRGYADTSLGQIHYRRVGAGEPILLLHNTNHSSAMFGDLMQVLASDYTCIAPDYPGFGNSDPLPEDATFPELAESLLEVLDVLDIGSATVLGLHTGNKLGAAMAARHSRRLDRFVLCGAPHSIIPDDDHRDTVIRNRVSESLRTYTAQSDESQLLKEWADLHRQVTDSWWDPAYIGDEVVTPDRIDRLSTHIIEKLQMRDGLRDMYNANFAYAWRADLTDIAVPTLILELSNQNEVEEHGLQGERLLELIPTAEWQLVEDAGVHTFFESPSSIADPLREYLESDVSP